MESFTFYFFGACTVLGGALVAFLPRLVHSAFSLVLCLFGVAGSRQLSAARHAQDQ